MVILVFGPGGMWNLVSVHGPPGASIVAEDVITTGAFWTWLNFGSLFGGWCSWCWWAGPTVLLPIHVYINEIKIDFYN